MSSKYKLKLKDFKLDYIKEYVAPMFNFLKPKKKITNIGDLKNFVQRKSAWVSQETLYGYLKTRMGTKYVLMFEDEIFLESINKAKWNIYSVCLQDLTLYCLSYLKNKYSFNQVNHAQNIVQDILKEEKLNGMPSEVIEKSKSDFADRIYKIQWSEYYSNSPFENSGYALYKWAPIADELKRLDKKIVLNSIHLKWENIKKEFSTLINL